MDICSKNECDPLKTLCRGPVILYCSPWFPLPTSLIFLHHGCHWQLNFKKCYLWITAALGSLSIFSPTFCNLPSRHGSMLCNYLMHITSMVITSSKKICLVSFRVSITTLHSQVEMSFKEIISFVFPELAPSSHLHRRKVPKAFPCVYGSVLSMEQRSILGWGQFSKHLMSIHQAHVMC